ncbi:hypothetical protein BDR26DRAFT_947780 [Obelidium mucronatum]|nr:hypothetical protein BDR26DRAFT_947780 [Obelidium mucronatum]
MQSTYTSSSSTPKPLILAAPQSIGNIGRLAVDLLLANSNILARHVITSPLVVPFACVDAASLSVEHSLNSAFEVVETDAAVIVQLRASIFKGHAHRFARDLAAWIAAQEFSAVVVLASFDEFKRTDAQIQTRDPRRFRVAAADAAAAAAWTARCAALRWRPLEAFCRAEEMRAGALLPLDAGLAAALLDALAAVRASVVLVSWFVPEDGFHFQQAMQMAQSVGELLDFGKSDHWKLPYSWHEAALTTSTATALYT